VGVASAPSFPTALVLPALSPAQRALLETEGQVILTDANGQEIATFTQRLIDDAAQHDVFAAPFAIDAPVRLVQGMKDASVPWQHGVKLAQHLESPDLKLTLIKEGDHLLHRPSDLVAIEQALLEVASLAMTQP
jgi:pimeloyl-ACP methyl ester carboxylesterase